MDLAVPAQGRAVDRMDPANLRMVVGLPHTRRRILGKRSPNRHLARNGRVPLVYGAVYGRQYMAVIIWNLLRKHPKQHFRILWLFIIGVAVQFGWEFTLLIGGIRSGGMSVAEQIKTLVVNSLMETNLGIPAIYCIYLFFTSKFTESCKRRENPTTFLGRLEESNDGVRV